MVACNNNNEKRKPTWTNWGLNQSANPKKIWYPQNLEELKAIVLEANKNEIRVHAYGSSHSFSDLVPTSGYLINTDSLNRVISIDFEKNQIYVEAGIKLADLNDVLEKNGLALSNLGRVTAQSIAGATATGTHGTGHTPTLSSFIVQVDLLAADGTLHTISADENPEWLSAARLTMGSLGVIYAMKIQCEPAFTLESCYTIADFDEILKNYPELAAKHDFWMFEWNPYTGKALTYAWDRTSLPPTNNLGLKVFNYFSEGVRNALSIIFKPFPQFAPALMDFRFYSSTHDCYRAKSYRALTREFKGMRYVECEQAIDPKLLPSAVVELKKLFKEYQTKNIYIPRVTFRFVAKEEQTLLSPTFDGDRVFISFVMPSHSPFLEVFQSFQERMKAFGARPHWGKIHEMNSRLAHQFYGERIDRFLSIQKRLDPKGIFLNAQIDAILNSK